MRVLKHSKIQFSVAPTEMFYSHQSLELSHTNISWLFIQVFGEHWNARSNSNTKNKMSGIDTNVDLMNYRIVSDANGTTVNRPSHIFIRLYNIYLLIFFFLEIPNISRHMIYEVISD